MPCTRVRMLLVLFASGELVRSILVGVGKQKGSTTAVSQVMHRLGKGDITLICARKGSCRATSSRA
jgi:hypothetical protein